MNVIGYICQKASFGAMFWSKHPLKNIEMKERKKGDKGIDIKQ